MEKVKTKDAVEIFYSSKRVPYSLMSSELEGKSSDLFDDLQNIANYYSVYKNGKDFLTEGSGGDYIPSQVRYRKAAQLINKEARFLFGEKPDIIVNPTIDVGMISDEVKQAISIQQGLLDAVLKSNQFQKKLIKAAKDCFIAGRVAASLNFNDATGITIQFHDAFSFVCEYDYAEPDKLVKFVSFTVVKDNQWMVDKRIIKKKFTIENDKVYVEEILYDGRGAEVEVITPKMETKLKSIPAIVILNDGLTFDEFGESEIAQIQYQEELYSKLSNADVDAERKSMNQVTYTIDMDSASTKSLSRSPGSFWDLQSNQDLESPSPSVGTISSSMDYSGALDTTLKRIRSAMYEELEIPDITLENMQGTITSGKALKSIYWPLIVRCKEKMKTWGPQLEYLFTMLLDGALEYPESIKKYTDDILTPVSRTVDIGQNFPLPEDEQEEKNMDLSEVQAQTMSRKSYMKKWRELTDDEAQQELEQIAMERQMLEDSYDDAAMMGGGFM